MRSPPSTHPFLSQNSGSPTQTNASDQRKSYYDQAKARTNTTENARSSPTRREREKASLGPDTQHRSLNSKQSGKRRHKKSEPSVGIVPKRDEQRLGSDKSCRHKTTEHASQQEWTVEMDAPASRCGDNSVVSWSKTSVRKIGDRPACVWCATAAKQREKTSGIQFFFGTSRVDATDSWLTLI